MASLIEALSSITPVSADKFPFYDASGSVAGYVTLTDLITAIAADPAGTAATLINRSTAVNAADTNYTTLMARGVSLNSTETTPAVNGAIAWTYE